MCKTTVPACWNLPLEVCVLYPTSPNDFFIWTAALCQIELPRRRSSYKAQNTQPRLLCDSRGYPCREIWPRRKAKDAFFMLQFAKSPICHTCFSLKCFWFLLAAREYPVCEPSCKSNKNYRFWIGKKVCACALASCKWTRKQLKKYHISATTHLTHNGLLLFLGQRSFYVWIF